eukprot:UN33585
MENQTYRYIERKRKIDNRKQKLVLQLDNIQTSLIEEKRLREITELRFKELKTRLANERKNSQSRESPRHSPRISPRHSPRHSSSKTPTRLSLRRNSFDSVHSSGNKTTLEDILSANSSSSKNNNNFSLDEKANIRKKDEQLANLVH